MAPLLFTGLLFWARRSPKGPIFAPRAFPRLGSGTMLSSWVALMTDAIIGAQQRRELLILVHTNVILDVATDGAGGR